MDDGRWGATVAKPLDDRCRQRFGPGGLRPVDGDAKTAGARSGGEQLGQKFAHPLGR